MRFAAGLLRSDVQFKRSGSSTRYFLFSPCIIGLSEGNSAKAIYTPHIWCVPDLATSAPGLGEPFSVRATPLRGCRKQIFPRRKYRRKATVSFRQILNRSTFNAFAINSRAIHAPKVKRAQSHARSNLTMRKQPPRGKPFFSIAQECLGFSQRNGGRWTMSTGDGFFRLGPPCTRSRDRASHELACRRDVVALTELDRTRRRSPKARRSRKFRR